MLIAFKPVRWVVDWPERIAAEFPAPIPNEPADVRDDIVDELHDHLACAYRRELLKDTDPQAAETAVLAQFGNPSQLARRLWFDALKEKIMANRLTIFFSATAATACIVLCVFAWFALEHAREANAALVRQLGELSHRPAAAPAAPESLDWMPVSVKLTLPPGTKPEQLSKALITLSGKLLNQGEEIRIERKPDSNGEVDFGRVRPGKHDLRVELPWGPDEWMSLVVTPGKPIRLEMDCPPPRAELRSTVVVDWPKEWKDAQIGIDLVFRAPNEETPDGRSWRISSDNLGTRYFLRSDGVMWRRKPGAQFSSWENMYPWLVDIEGKPREYDPLGRATDAPPIKQLPVAGRCEGFVAHISQIYILQNQGASPVFSRQGTSRWKMTGVSEILGSRWYSLSRIPLQRRDQQFALKLPADLVKKTAELIARLKK